MDVQRAEEAAALLFELRKTGRKIDGLPSPLKPKSMDDVRAIQDAVDRRIPEPIAGYKFHKKPNTTLCYAPLYASRLFRSPARIPLALADTLAIEAEITFRAISDLPARAAPYSEDEAKNSFEACAAFEVVASRFADFKKMADTALLEVYADHMSNGGFVLSEFQRDWRAIDFTKVRISMRQGERILADRIGGHPNGQPGNELPFFVNYLRERQGIKAGTIIATGSFTSFHPMEADAEVVAEFYGFGTCRATIYR